MLTEDSFSLNFDDNLLSRYFYIEDIRGRGIIGQEVELLEIPGMDGAYVSDTKIGVRPIEVDIAFLLDSEAELRKTVEVVNGMLLKKVSSPLIFEDEPDRIYYATCGGVYETFEWGGVHRATITFICADPHKYGMEKATTFADAGTFNVNGMVETYPNIKVEIKKDTTFVAVSDGEKINIIGNPAEVTQQPFVREERKFWHEMGTLVGWADTTNIEEGKNLGTMKTNGYSFYTDTYGSDPAWHGPAKKISIGSTIQDFQVDALIRQLGSSGQVGSIEIALLDASNRFVCKMLMTKRSAGSKANWARMRAGTALSGYDILNTRGANENTWSNFNGMVRIARIGNVWTAYVCLIDSKGVQHTRAFSTPWKDSLGIATAPIAQVQVQLWQYGTTPATNQNIDDIKVYKINSAGANQVPYIASVDDVIEFDHVNDKVFRNGELLTREKMFIGEYFALQPGLKSIVVEPADAIRKTEVRWKPKWL